MFILFPSDPYQKREIDPDFAVERDAARAAGFDTALFHLESLQEGTLTRALAATTPAPLPDTPLLYRGWMMRGEQYGQLCDGLRGLGYKPVTGREQYEEAHYLPLALPHLGDATPRTVFMTGQNEEQAWQLYGQMQGSDAIIKDWVKSAKYRWREACFIPAGTNRERFGEVFAAFLDERGPLFDQGVVLRRFHRLRSQGEDMRGMPLHEEYRLFCWDGSIIVRAPFADETEFEKMRGKWQEIASRFSSRFLTIDVAREEDGGWTIIETGDGGVSGLPLSVEPDDFYRALFAAVSETGLEADS